MEVLISIIVKILWKFLVRLIVWILKLVARYAERYSRLIRFSRNKKRFRFALYQLEGDEDRLNTDIVAQAFTSISGIELILSKDIIEVFGAADFWIPEMKKRTCKSLRTYKADVAVVGRVKKSEGALNLWFVPREDDGTLARGDRQVYELVYSTLQKDFHDDLEAQIVATSLAVSESLVNTEVRRGVLKNELSEFIKKLETYIYSGSITDPSRRALLYHSLGVAQSTLGKHTDDIEMLEEAVNAYQTALGYWNSENAPLHWAMAKSNLGITLRILGERNGDTEYLKQAVECYCAAFKKYASENDPSWVISLNNLSNILLLLGKSERNFGYLEKSVNNFRSILDESTRREIPLNLIAVLNNLGSSVYILGRLSENPELIRSAIEIFDTALRDCPRKQMPSLWASIKNNIGSACATFGEIEGDTECLEKAVLAFRSALKERTFKLDALNWAVTKNNLANTFRILGERKENVRLIRRSITIFREVQRKFTAQNLHCTTAKNGIQKAQTAIERLSQNGGQAA